MIDKRNLKDCYRHYRATSPDPTLSDRPKYVEITSGFAKFIMNKVREGHEVELSSANTLGTLYMGSTKHKAIIVEDEETGETTIKGLPPDWGTTRKMWTKKATELGMTFKEYVEKVPKEQRQVIYHTNDGTDGLTYSYKWSMFNSKLANKFFYSLIFTRANKRAVKPALKNGAEFLSVKQYLDEI